ncbi:MAG: hypothetical protein E7315_03640 [Clostridiales bacterium]|nr:hypothetical protein [Clostridiales bacterium]
MKSRHINSIRIPTDFCSDKNRFNELLDMLNKYPCEISQLAIFAALNHPPAPLDRMYDIVEKIKPCMDMGRKEGYECGINILATIGHHCENLEIGLGDKYTYMTGIKGDVCMGSYCMRNEKYIEEYVVPCYKLLANSHPDFIWIDDDIRYAHWPIGYGCFCDNCIDTFNKKHSTSYNRETLRLALEEENVEFRKKWLNHNSDAICHLFEVIGKTVRSIDPSIRLGFMTGERYFEGYQFERYSEALSENGKYEIMWRPGGGGYSDIRFDELVEKQEQIGRQNAYLPDYVTIIQSEIENFPYNLAKKMPHSTLIEALMSMTAGCTGAAFNVVGCESGEPLEAFEPMFKGLNKYTKFMRLLNEHLYGLSPEGIHTGWRIDSQAALPKGEYFNNWGGAFAEYARELFVLGLPECYHKDKANAVTLFSKGCSVMSDEEILSLLSGGVYINADALTYLNSRGFGEYTGFDVKRAIDTDAIERYTDHKINNGMVGGARNCHQAFYPGDSYELVPTNDNAEIISEIVNCNKQVTGKCACGMFKNSLGGIVCVAGYYPFSGILDTFKSRQLKRIFLELSKGTLVSFIDSYSRIRNVTLTGNGKICVTLFNLTTDDGDDIVVAVRTDKNEGTFYAMDGSEHAVKAFKRETLSGGNYAFFNVGVINSFRGGLLEI